MGKHAKTLRLIEEAQRVLADHHPMTVRQVYYRLVSGQVIENSRSAYQGVSNVLVRARQEGAVSWDWMEDRNRRPREVSMWDNLADFADTATRAYRRDVWGSQPGYVECWLEKDALSGIFESVLTPYGVTLCVGRGYDGWSSIKWAADRYGDGSGVTVLYWGDLDPSGEDMVRSLIDRLAFFGCKPEVVKCALTIDDVRRYNLPPDFTKTTDTRRAAFVAKYGDVAVELDALPPTVLENRIIAEVERRMNTAALEAVRLAEDRDRKCLVTLLSTGEVSHE